VKNAYILLGFALTTLACEDALEPAQRIDQPRVLGVRVSTERGEASLVPGKPANLEFLLAGPDGPQPARIAYRFCEAASSERGVPYCEQEPWAEGVANVVDGPVALDVPAALGPGLRLALLGVACAEGEPTLADASLDHGCSGNADPLRFSFDAWTLENAPQLNPDLTGLVVTLGDENVHSSGADAAPTCDDATPALEAAQSHTLSIELGAAAAPANELQISLFSTRGKLERQFSFVAAEQEPRVVMTWQAPAEAGPVKQYLVARDGAGGVSWATWNVCVR
jgi:hypothetical protein